MNKNTFFSLIFLGLLAFFIAITTNSAKPLLQIFKSFGTTVSGINDGRVEGVNTQATPEATTSGEYAIVKKVVDGDTIELDNGKKVRYIGVDTPETKHPTKGVECYGKEASEKNTLIVLGKQVRLEKDVSETDRYGRLLRYVYLGDTMVNKLLVDEGYARAATFPPDVKYQAVFKASEAHAKAAEVGLWGLECGGKK